MRIMVTGGCGFIGSNFLRFVLSNIPQTFILNVDKLTYAGNLGSTLDIQKNYPDTYVFAHADITDKATMEQLLVEHNINAVVNFAAESHVDRSIDDASPFIETNINGTHVLLHLAHTLGIKKFVHVSTDEVYGTLGATGKFTEKNPLAPNSPYSASKASADLLCRAWFETYNFPVVITRCSNNYGPYQFPEKLIPLLYMKAIANENLPIYGNGLNVRDWIYVEDHCRGVWLALEKGVAGKAYNFGGDAERTNIEVAQHILDYAQAPHSLIQYIQDRPGHDQRYAMDYSLAELELGFTPEWTFEKGLKHTLDWYTQNQPWVKDVVSGAYREFMQKWYGDRQ